MADFDSSLPIRTQDAGDVIVKVADATVPSQQLKVESDGSINVNSTVTLPGTTKVQIWDGTDTLSVNADGSINSVVSATDLDIRNLVFATDKVDASGSSVSISGSVVVTATDLDIRDLAFATDKVDVSGSSVSVTATDLDIRDLSAATDSVAIKNGSNQLAVNSDGSINAQITKKNGTSSIADFNQATAVAAASSNTHTFTSTGNFNLEQVEASGSGKMKIEVQVNSVTKAVMFNSTANPNMSLHLEQPILATTGQTVTVIRTNLDNQAQNLYSTIIGYNA